MKTIIYSLIAIFIFGIIATGYTNKTNTKTIFLIESTESNTSSVSLSQSAEIISNRLKDFSSKKYEVNTIPEKNQIQIVLSGKWDEKTVEKLILQKGNFAFYETYNHKSLVELLNGDNQLFSLFKVNNPKDSDAIIGCISKTEIGKNDAYLNSLGLKHHCKFAWEMNTADSNCCLYALKIDNEKGALMVGTEIESVKCSNVSKYAQIDIVFKKSAIELFANATKHNMNCVIAIVVDNTVLSAPIVRSEINGGKCNITGNYSATEASYIAALCNNGELPLYFKIVK